MASMGLNPQTDTMTAQRHESNLTAEPRRILRDRLAELGLDLNAIPVELHPMLLQSVQTDSQATSSMSNLFSTFLQRYAMLFDLWIWCALDLMCASVVPSWGGVGVRYGGGGQQSRLNGVDILDVPGLVEFLTKRP
jgi:hypothetical protein